MNINKLPITDNLQEQISYGKEIAGTYDKKMMSYISSKANAVKNCQERYGMSNEDLMYKTVYDYWMYGFSPEQEVYLNLVHKSHEEKLKYVSFQMRFLYYSCLNKKEDMHILENKYEAYQLLKEYYKRDVIKISSDEDYETFLKFVERHPSFIVKPLGLSSAMGVRKVDMAKYHDTKALFDELVNVGHAFDDDYSIKWTDRNGAILEELIQQDEEFGKMHPASVNGIRLTTIRRKDKVFVYKPWYKCGVINDVVASADTGGFDAGINAKTGIIETDAVFEDGSTKEFHPTTHVKVKGYVIPKWQELLELADKLARSLKPTINYVGWDFVLTPKGWVIIEANYYGDMLWQMIYQKGMRDDMEQMIGWHKDDNKFWWQYKHKKLEQMIDNENC